MGVYVGISENRIMGDAKSVKEALNLSKDQISESIEFLTVSMEIPSGGQKCAKESGTSTSCIVLYVYNSGIQNMTVSKVIVNDSEYVAKTDDGNLVLVEDLDKNDQNLVFGKDITSRLKIDTTSILPAISQVSDVNNVIIISESFKIIEFRN